MRALPYALLLLFSMPILVLMIYLCESLYMHTQIIRYFTQDTFISAVKHSLILSSLSSLFALLVGICLAKAFFALEKNKLRVLYILALAILFMIQPIMLLSVVKQLNFFVTFNALSQSLFIATLHLAPLATFFWIMVYRYMQTESLHIAYYIASAWSTYWRIIFPQLGNKILLAFLFLFILVFIDQEAPSLLGYHTYTEELVSQMTLMEEMQTIVLSAFPSFLLVGLLAFGFIFWFKKNLLFSTNNTYVIKQGNTYFGKMMLFILYISLGSIVFILLNTSLSHSMHTLFNDNSQVIVQTFIFALSVALVTLILGIFFQNMLHYYASRVMHILWAVLLTFYLLLPHSLISLSLLDIYQKIGFFSETGDFLIFFLGYVFVLLPLSCLLLYLFSFREQRDHFLDFFAVSTYQRWKKIIFPGQWPSWMIIFLILIVFALNELSVSILLVPPGFETMIVKIYNLLHYGDKANIAFLSLVQLLFLVSCFIILLLLGKKAFR